MKKYILSATVALWALSACGKWADSDPLPIESIESPQYPKQIGSVFDLSPGVASIGFGGTMVVWNENVSPQNIADLLQASIDSRLAWTRSKEFSEQNDYDLKYSEGGIYARALKDMKASLNAFEAEEKEKLGIDYETLRTSSDNLLDDELNLLFPNNIDMQNSTRVIFHTYCEAKIWDLATNSFFAANQYAERPTPLAMCEPYYRSNGFFSDESCSPASEGKNYLSCFWNSGVKNSSFYQSYNTDQKNIISELISPDSIASMGSILALKDDAFTFKSPIYKRRTIGENKENRTYFSDLILAQSKGSKLCQAIIPENRSLCSAFQKSYSKDQISSLEMSPFDYISMIEGTNAERSSLLPLPPRPNSNFNTKQMLAYLGQRYAHKNSESDRMFHKVVEGQVPFKQNPSDAILASLSSEIENSLSGRLYPALTGESLNQYLQRKAQISDLESDLNFKTRFYNDLTDDITETSDRAFTVANRSEVAHSLVEIRFKVSNRQGLLRGYFWIKDFEDVVVLGCLDLAANVQKNDSCSPAPEDKIEANLVIPAKSFHRDRTTGRIDFEIDLEMAETIGFSPKERLDLGSETFDSFNDFKLDYLADKTLRLEAYPNVVRNIMDILTGKAFISDGSTDIHEAAISLWDQNL